MPHVDAAYNLARWIVRADHDAQDIVQEACLRAWRGFDAFRGMDGRTWLLTIVRNTSLNHLRRNSTHPAEELPEEIGESDSEACDPQAIAVRAADSQRVKQAIDALPVEYREIVVLREMEEMSYKQISGVTGLPIGTVMSRLARGRKRLRQLLDPPWAR